MECNCCRLSCLEACVLERRCCALLVQDLSSCQEVVVNTNRARCFCPGDRVAITYDGVMSLSEPPRISARRICCCGCQRSGGCGCDCQCSGDCDCQRSGGC